MLIMTNMLGYKYRGLNSELRVAVYHMAVLLLNLLMELKKLFFSDFLHPFKDKAELKQKSSQLIFAEINLLEVAKFLNNDTDNTLLRVFVLQIVKIKILGGAKETINLKSFILSATGLCLIIGANSAVMSFCK